MEKTVVILKPDALQRGIIGEIISRLERKGLKLVAAKMIMASEKLLSEHYAHHKDKPFFPGLKKYMSSTPLLCMVWEGFDAVAVVRRMAGSTNGREADLGSIRGDYSISVHANTVHVSDSGESADVEVKRFFDKEEIFDWDRAGNQYFYGEDELK